MKTNSNEQNLWTIFIYASLERQNSVFIFNTVTKSATIMAKISKLTIIWLKTSRAKSPGAMNWIH